MDKKKPIKDKLVDFWNGMTDGAKGFIAGGISGIIVTAITAAIVCNKKEDSWIKTSDSITDVESKIAYQNGLHDGQIKAYHDILFDPANTFKKLGMEVKQF